MPQIEGAVLYTSAQNIEYHRLHLRPCRHNKLPPNHILLMLWANAIIILTFSFAKTRLAERDRFSTDISEQNGIRRSAMPSWHCSRAAQSPVYVGLMVEVVDALSCDAQNSQYISRYESSPAVSRPRLNTIGIMSFIF